MSDVNSMPSSLTKKNESDGEGVELVVILITRKDAMGPSSGIAGSRQ